MELVINFSGGKDSSAMLAYICEKCPNIKKHVIYANTGWEHENAEQWCRQIVGMFGLELHVVQNPNKTFLTMSEKRGKFPGMQQRQCTSDLKRDPINTWIRNNVTDPVVVNCMGLRAEESSGRAKKMRMARNGRMTNSKRTVWDWLPIKDWTESQVLAYLKIKGIPLHPVYNHLRRFSCRVCIYMTQHDLKQVHAFDPQAIDIIAEIEAKTGFTMFAAGKIKELLQ
jgi:3'-phosphoadenosine 5'-phosphosulfate sulfotransferase (PAPS reductase)/FAD synthetase